MSPVQPYSAIDYLQSFRAGQECGFNHYFNKWFRSLCFFASHFTNDGQDTEDIVSDAFIKTWQKHSIFTNENHLRNYLYISVRNGCLRKLGQQKVAEKYRQALLHNAEKEEACFLKHMLHTELISRLYESFRHLPPACRRVLSKLYIEGKTITEIANELNQATSTIATHRKYGLKILRRHTDITPKRSLGSG